MTTQAQDSVQSPISNFIPRYHQSFAGLDVDKHSIAGTFCNQTIKETPDLCFLLTGHLYWLAVVRAASLPRFLRFGGVDLHFRI